MNKRYRLRNNADFEKVYKYGRTVVNRHLVLKYKKTDFSLLRFGFSVSKKYGKAVTRNRIRRQLKDILQKQACNVKTGHDIVFLVRQDAKDMPYSILARDVENLLKKAKLID